jgi:predicted amidophosphoribosyltransferase
VNLLDLIFPPRCGGCGGHGQNWCQRCAATIQPVAVTTLNGILLVAVGRLSGPLQRAIHTYKYRPRPGLAGVLADPLGQAVIAAGLTIPALTFVPLHPSRQRQRGFNQAERLAVRLGAGLRLPVVGGLSRLRPTPAQDGLGQAERRAIISSGRPLSRHRSASGWSTTSIPPEPPWKRPARS